MDNKDLIAAFIKAQGEIKGALKDADNPFFKSKYADLSSVVEAIKPALQKHKLGFIQVSHDADNCACIETVIVHDSGQTFSAGRVSVPVSKGDAQGYGSAMTYARRYSLSAAFGVCPEDDDGNAAAKAKPESSKSIGQAEYDNLPAAIQQSLTDLKTEVMDAFDPANPEKAYDLYAQTRDNLPDEGQQMAFRGLFPSNVRTAFTKIFNARKESK